MLSAAWLRTAGPPVSQFYSGFNSHDGQAKVQPSLVRGPGEAWGGSAHHPIPAAGGDSALSRPLPGRRRQCRGAGSSSRCHDGEETENKENTDNTGNIKDMMKILQNILNIENDENV